MQRPKTWTESIRTLFRSKCDSYSARVFDLTLDMSLNELSVHYLKHSKVDTEDPFKTLVGLYEQELK